MFRFQHSRRRRSRRTRFRNLRYKSTENEMDAIVSHSPDDLENNVKESDEDFLLQVPSSSTPARQLQPKNMQKRKIIPVDSLAQVLKEIGVYEDLYEFMKSRGISADALKYMKVRHIDELFKGTRFSTKIIFEHKLRLWQNKLGICEVSTTQTAQSTCVKTNSPTKKTEEDYSTKNHNNIQIPKLDASTTDPILSTPVDTTNLSNRLMEVIQEAVNKVLMDIKQSPKKSADFELNGNDETPFPEITEDKGAVLKLEEFPMINMDEIPRTEKIQKKVSRREKSPKPSTQITNSNVSRNYLSTDPFLQPKKRKLDQELWVTVNEILDLSTFGERFKEEYNATGILTPKQRTELVHTVVDFYLKNDLLLNVHRCREIAEQIIDLFPTECLETYFAQYNKSQPPKGKVWDRFQGRRRTLRKLINSSKTPTQNNQTDKNKTSSNDTTELDDNVDKANWSEMETLCSQMKNVKDERELLKQWKESFAFRRYQLQSEWFSNWKFYFDEYPFCKQQNYAQYIEADLHTLYPNLRFDEVLWYEFLKNFKTFFLNRIKHPKSKCLFDELLSIKDLDTTSDYVAIKVVELLHAVLKVHNKNLVGIEDAQRLFTVEVNDLPDLKKVVIERKKLCTENNQQAKPYIAVVGNNRSYSHFSVILDSTGFSCDNYKDSLILCFNLYLFFDLSFPKESMSVWLFVQKYFFNKPSLVGNPRVDTFINDIKAQKQMTIDIKNGIFEK